METDTHTQQKRKNDRKREKWNASERNSKVFFLKKKKFNEQQLKIAELHHFRIGLHHLKWH